MVSVLGDSRVSGQWQLLSADNNVYTTITCIYCIYIYMVEYCLPKGLVSSLCQFFLFNNLLHGAHRQTMVDTLYLLIIL